MSMRSAQFWLGVGERKADRRWEAAVDRVRARYPEDVLTADGRTADAAAAFLARLVCDEIRRLAR
jgi:hypothetical protein